MSDNNIFSYNKRDSKSTYNRGKNSKPYSRGSSRSGGGYSKRNRSEGGRKNGYTGEYTTSSSNYEYSDGNRSNRSGNSYSQDRNDSRGGGYRRNDGYRSSRYGNRGGGYGNNNRGRGGNRSRFNRNSIQETNINKYISAEVTPELETSVEYVGINFADFNLSKPLSDALTARDYLKTTAIQEQTIPLILKGENLLGISETGSGKTGAFLIPMIEKMLNDKAQKALIIAPTRELAQQILKEALKFISGMNIQLVLVIGGENMQRQIETIKRNPQIVIGTPGRLNDLINQGKLSLSSYNNVVIDEVDRMLEMGFIDDITRIYRSLAQEKQTLFFSATYNATVEKVAKSLCNTFHEIRLSHNKPNENVIQSVIQCTNNDEKFPKLLELLKTDKVTKSIIFVETKRFADKVGTFLYENNFRVGVLHGDKRQSQRSRVVDSFKTGKIDILVATNVAARGLDIYDVTTVINLDEPLSYEEYIHRIGRTGRNGLIGHSYTFVVRRNFDNQNNS